MSEKEIEQIVDELANDNSELYFYVAENIGENASDDEIDSIVSDLEGDPFEIRNFIISSLED